MNPQQPGMPNLQSAQTPGPQPVSPGQTMQADPTAVQNAFEQQMQESLSQMPAENYAANGGQNGAAIDFNSVNDGGMMNGANVSGVPDATNGYGQPAMNTVNSAPEMNSGPMAAASAGDVQLGEGVGSQPGAQADPATGPQAGAPGQTGSGAADNSNAKTASEQSFLAQTKTIESISGNTMDEKPGIDISHEQLSIILQGLTLFISIAILILQFF